MKEQDFLNNEMDDFSAKPGSPNVYGLIGNEANSIEPNKRPLSSMTPTIVLKGQRPYMVIGSPGGSTIITTVLQCLLNVIEFKMDIKEAVSSPRFHSQWLPDVIQVEPRSLSNDVLNNLKKKGHKIAPYKWGYIGEANGILILEDLSLGEEIAEEKHPQLDIKLIFKYTINNIQKYGCPNTKCLLVNVIV